MNEEQRKQRDARVAELTEAALAYAEHTDQLAPADADRLRVEIRARINQALDEQAKEIAAAIRVQVGDGNWAGDYYSKSADIAASFGDDRAEPEMGPGWGSEWGMGDR